METLDLSYLQAKPVVLRQWDHLHLVLVGCGGTGSWLAPSIARLALVMKQAGKNVGITFCDPDRVEEANIPRQNFCQAEWGANKAEALALRYSMAWGSAVIAAPCAFSPERAPRPSERDLLLIVGCVDNAAARLAIHKTLEDYSTYSAHGGQNTWWLDCGNAENSGQVLLGCATKVEGLALAFSPSTICRALPAPSLQRPELLEALPEERGGGALSCAQIAVANAQSLMINQAVAAVAAQYLLELLMVGGLRRFATYIDLPSGVNKSLYTTSHSVARAVSMQSDVLEAKERERVKVEA